MDYNFQDGTPQQAMPLNSLFPDNHLQMYNSIEQQASVLDSNDQGYLNSFFANPNNTVPLDVLPGASLSMDTKEEQSADGETANFRLNSQPQTINPAVTYAAPSSMYTSYAAGSNGSPAVGSHPHAHGHGHMWNTPSHNHASTDDAAANSLVNLAKTAPQQQQTPAFTNDPQQVMSWGNFTAPHLFNQQMNLNYAHGQYGYHSPTTPQAPPNYQLPQFPRHHSISYAPEHPDYHAFARAQQHTSQAQPLSESGAIRSRHMSIDTTSGVAGQLQQHPPPPSLQGLAQSPTTAMRRQDRPQVPVRFGSDGNFGSEGYRNPTDRQVKHDKSGNLLNAFGVPLPLPGMPGVPLKQSRAPSALNTGSTHSAQSSPVKHSGLPMPSPSSAKHSKSFGDAENGGGNRGTQQSSRKRRRPGDAEHDDDYMPESSTSRRGKKPFKEEVSDGEDDDYHASTSKRRQSTAFQGYGSDQSGSPAGGGEDDDDEGETGSRKKRRGSKKARENLSESQKRFNHILSEKKRRNVINEGYADLNRLVPVLSQGKSGMSRSESLAEVASFLESLVEGTREIMHYLGVDPDDDLGGIIPGQAASTSAASRYYDQDYD